MSDNANKRHLDRILGWGEVIQLVHYSRTQLWRKIKDGTFPPPLKLGARKVGWRESTIFAWLDSREAVAWAPAAEK